jgi:hypothetical protein
LEELRKAILFENPLNYDDFACLFQFIKYDKEKLVKGIILDPYLTGNDNNRIINILIDGFMLSFYLDSRSLSFEEKYPFIKEDGSMVIIGRIILNDPFLFKILIKSYAFLKHKLN